MVDETLRSIYSAADETVAQLDQLNRASQERALTSRQALDAAVGGLGDSSLPFVENWEGPGTGGGQAPSQPQTRPVPADETPYVPLPQRTTHGGPWGPAMVQKLTAEALAKDNRW